MIIKPNLLWRTFRYWVVKAADVRDMGSIDTIPLLNLTSTQSQQICSTASALIEKKIQIFFIYKEIQSGAVAKSYKRKGFLAQIFPHI